jgi:4-hydroxybenzoate polyprenyltransferase
MRLKPYLQLVRLPNVFTAAADSLAGWLLVRGTLAEPGRWMPLVFASMAIYAAGIALNDYFDVELDRRERPGRPLPAGAVSMRFALGLAVVLLLAGLLAAFAGGGVAGLAVAVLLIACVVLYDAGMRRTGLGPFLMGLCRGLNLLLGMAAAAWPLPEVCWLAVAGYGLFVVGLTWVSRSETETAGPLGIVSGLVVQNLSLLLLATVCLFAARFPGAGDESNGPPLAGLAPFAGLGILGVIALLINRAAGQAVADPKPAVVQAAVKTSVLSLVWLNVALVLAVRGPEAALAVASLWIPAYLLARWLYTT